MKMRNALSGAMALALLMLGWPAWAVDQKVSTLPNASTLTGSEQVYCVQGGASKNCTALQFRDYLESTLDASHISIGVLGSAHGGAGSITGALKANGSGVVSQAACSDLSNASASCSTDATNAANISSGVLAAARGGAGTINGALKANGSGVVSRAACSDLSNAAASCSTDTTNAANISSGVLGAARGGAGTANGILQADGAGNVSAASTTGSGSIVRATSPTFGTTVTLPHVNGNKFYSDNGSPQPTRADLGDKARFGAAIGLSEVKNPSAGTWTWGTDYASDYIGRDAMAAGVQTNGGYGYVTYGRNSDYQNNPSNYQVTTGFGTFQLCDSDSGALTNTCEGLYAEIVKTANHATVLGAELNLGNRYGPPPVPTPYAAIAPGAMHGFVAGTQVSKSTSPLYAVGAAFATNVRLGAFYDGLLIERGSIYGSNGTAAVTVDVTTSTGSKQATVTSLTGLTPGMYVNDAAFGGLSFLQANADPNIIVMSSVATSTGTVSLTFYNFEAPAIELPAGSVGYAMEWLNPNGAKGAFLRADLTGSQTSLGQIFYTGGVAWVGASGFPGSETTIARIDTSGNFYNGNTQILTVRQTGWGAPTGTLDRTALASYAGQTIGGSYSQSEVQAIDNAVKKASQELAALITDLRTHGVIGN